MMTERKADQEKMEAKRKADFEKMMDKRNADQEKGRLKGKPTEKWQ
jgi:hypothetical protein